MRKPQHFMSFLCMKSKKTLVKNKTSYNFFQYVWNKFSTAYIQPEIYLDRNKIETSSRQTLQDITDVFLKKKIYHVIFCIR